MNFTGRSHEGIDVSMYRCHVPELAWKDRYTTGVFPPRARTRDNREVCLCLTVGKWTYTSMLELYGQLHAAAAFLTSKVRSGGWVDDVPALELRSAANRYTDCCVLYCGLLVIVRAKAA